MQFQVPQYIEVEDKIVGPFTLRQFFYIAGAGGASFVLFFYVSQFLWFMLSVVFLGVAAGLAFVRINGQPLLRIGHSAVSFYWQPQTYVWQPEHPRTLKTESALKGIAQGFSLERIVSGISLRSAWQNVQTGSKTTLGEGSRLRRANDRYEIIRRITGERRAARRVDYR